MADASSFTKLVPGFDFLQGLVKNASSALPNMGQWVAPTLNPEELEKRIEELRTVQFWLEQNARMLGATIQALEVQRMTLSTLKTMNVQMTDLREAMKLAPVASVAGAAGSVAQSLGAESMLNAAKAAAGVAPAPKKAAASAPEGAAAGSAEAPAGVVDPMQWWGALTKQFTQLAANAMKDTATDAAKNLAGTLVKQSFDAAGETLKKAVAMPAAAAQKAVSAATAAAAESAASRKKAPASPARKTAARKSAASKARTAR